MKTKVGECKFAGFDCNVYELQYAGNGRTALGLFDKADGQPVATATVNLPGDDIEDGFVFIKDYSENAGILDALVEAKIIGPAVSTVRSGYVKISVCPLLVKT